VPRAEDLAELDAANAELFHAASARLGELGGEPVPVDLTPFFAAGRLLYGGAWLAERYAAIQARIATCPDALHPVVRDVIAGGARPSAVDAFEAYYRLRGLARTTQPLWKQIDVLLAPTAPGIPRIADVLADPIDQNARLGRFTTFVNLLDLSALAVPAGFRPDGLPFGVSLLAPAFHEARLLELGHRLHAAAAIPMGATPHPVPEPAPSRARASARVEVAVCGAHMSGLRLNSRLVDRGARLVEVTATAPAYRLVDLGDGRPGLERVAGGAAIEVEVWDLPVEGFGALVAEIPAPLGIGTITLAGGRAVKGFLCETVAARDAVDITHYGGWRKYLASR
jgi:allophanate hydrolase